MGAIVSYLYFQGSPGLRGITGPKVGVLQHSVTKVWRVFMLEGVSPLGTLWLRSLALLPLTALLYFRGTQGSQDHEGSQ